MRHFSVVLLALAVGTLMASLVWLGSTVAVPKQVTHMILCRQSLIKDVQASPNGTITTYHPGQTICKRTK